MRRLLWIMGVLVTAVPVATITMATVAPAVASAHDNGDGPTNDAAYTGTDCGGWYRSPITHAFWYDCWVKDDDHLHEVVVPGEYTHYHVWGLYTHWREWEYQHVSWRDRYWFS